MSEGQRFRSVVRVEHQPRRQSGEGSGSMGPGPLNPFPGRQQQEQDDREGGAVAGTGAKP